MVEDSSRLYDTWLGSFNLGLVLLKLTIGCMLWNLWMLWIARWPSSSSLLLSSSFSLIGKPQLKQLGTCGVRTSWTRFVSFCLISQNGRRKHVHGRDWLLFDALSSIEFRQVKSFRQRCRFILIPCIPKTNVGCHSAVGLWCCYVSSHFVHRVGKLHDVRLGELGTTVRILNTPPAAKVKVIRHNSLLVVSWMLWNMWISHFDVPVSRLLFTCRLSVVKHDTLHTTDECWTVNRPASECLEDQLPTEWTTSRNFRLYVSDQNLFAISFPTLFFWVCSYR